MRRTERLFAIIQILRSARGPVTAGALAQELEVSERTLYRDMAELMAQRVPVRGEAGTGYVLDAGYDLPPLMLTADELEAAVLGAAWVAARGDPALARGARDLVAKLTAVVPEALRPVVLDAGLRPFAPTPVRPEQVDLSAMRVALRERRKVVIRYADVEGRETERCVWPIVISYAEDVRMLAAWCELREDFRHFRTDRIRALTLTDVPIPERADRLRTRWRAQLRPFPCPGDAPAAI